MTDSTQTQLDELFELTQKLAICLDEDNFVVFQEMETTFSSQTRQFLDNTEQLSLQNVLPQLIKLQQVMQTLQDDAEQKQALLKQQALSQKRNKNKLNAYKQNTSI